MTNSEKIKLGRKMGISDKVSIRLEKESEFMPVPDCCAELQWQILKNPKWAELSENDMWCCERIARTVGFAILTPPTKDDLYELGNSSSDVLILSTMTGKSVKELKSLPQWIGVLDVQRDKRLIANDWVKNGDITEGKYQTLPDDDIDFLVATCGFGDLCGDREKELGIADKYPDQIKRALWFYHEIGEDLDVLEKEKASGGLGAFSDELIVYLWKTPFLDLLREKVPEKNALVEQRSFYEFCKFELFTEVPDIMLKTWNRSIPNSCYFTPQNIEFLREKNADFCIQFGGKGKWSSRVSAFWLLQRPESEWKKLYGKDYKRLLEYLFDWNEEGLRNKELVFDLQLIGRIQLASLQILKRYKPLCYYLESLVIPRKSWKKIVELEKSGFLKKMNSLFTKYYDCRESFERLTNVFAAYLNGESVGIPSVTGKSVDFVDAFYLAEKYLNQYRCCMADLILNFLDGNRFEKNGKLMITLNKVENGVLVPTTIEEDERPDGIFVWGVTCALSQILFRGGEVVIEPYPRIGLAR